MNIACDLFATTMLKSLETVLPLELCAQVVIQPRSQGLSSAHPLSGILSSPSPGGRKEENEGNEVECYYLGKNIFKQRGGNLDLPQVDFCLIHRLFISLARSEGVISSDVNYWKGLLESPWQPGMRGQDQAGRCAMHTGLAGA